MRKLKAVENAMRWNSARLLDKDDNFEANLD